MTKQELRQFVRAQKKLHSAAQMAAMSEEICSRVLDSDCWQKSETLLLYYPLADEVDVRPLIFRAVEAGKRVLLPVCVGNDLELYPYEGDASLVVGSYGIMEPAGTQFPPERYSEIDLAIVPGMAYDRSGHRLGRGKGYYDRLLPRLDRARRQGVCFPFQFLAEVPADDHDVSVHDVITTEYATAQQQF